MYQNVMFFLLKSAKEIFISSVLHPNVLVHILTSYEGDSILHNV